MKIHFINQWNGNFFFLCDISFYNVKAIRYHSKIFRFILFNLGFTITYKYYDIR